MEATTTNPRTFIRQALNEGTRIWIHWNYYGWADAALLETEGYVLSASRSRFTVQDHNGVLVELRYEYIVEMMGAE